MITRRRLLDTLGRAGGSASPSHGQVWSRRHFTVSSHLQGTQIPNRSYKPRQRQRQHQLTQQTQQTQQKDSQSTESETLARRQDANRKFAMVGAGLVAAIGGFYIAMVVMSIFTGPPESDEHDLTPSGRPLLLRQGKVSATAFDRDLDGSEKIMGVKGLRRLMGGLARGHVLEVAVGTGRNIQYIDWDEIRATAPPIATEDGTAAREVKSEKQLERERRLRLMEKHQRGEALPGDEAPEVLSFTGVDVSTDVLEVAWLKLKESLPELVPRRKRRSQEEGGVQQPVQQQQESEPRGRVTSWLGKAATAVLPTSSPTTVAASSSSTSSLLHNDEDLTLAANLGQGRIRLYKADAQTRLPPPPTRSSHDGTKILPAPPYYDTIVQNFGLCSVSDPQRMLANMAALLRPHSGRIYLLEHGRGWPGWLNTLLDKFAPSHFKKYGCWWNRDIEAIVRQAEEQIPGLEVVRIDKPLVMQFGTMTWVELRVNSDKKPTSDTEIGRG